MAVAHILQGRNEVVVSSRMLSPLQFVYSLNNYSRRRAWVIVAVSFLPFACGAAFAVPNSWRIRKKVGFGHGAPTRLSTRLDDMYTVCGMLKLRQLILKAFLLCSWDVLTMSRRW